MGMNMYGYDFPLRGDLPPSEPVLASKVLQLLQEVDICYKWTLFTFFEFFWIIISVNRLCAVLLFLWNVFLLLFLCAYIKEKKDFFFFSLVTFSDGLLIFFFFFFSCTEIASTNTNLGQKRARALLYVHKYRNGCVAHCLLSYFAGLSSFSFSLTLFLFLMFKLSVFKEH